MNNRTLNKVMECALHIMTWAVTLFFPHIKGNESFWESFLSMRPFIVFPLSMVVIFYINYLWAVPRLFFQKKYNKFILLNISVYILAVISLSLIFPPRPMENETETMMLKIYSIFKLRDVISYLLLTALAIVLHMSFRFRKAEEERQQSELKYAESELKNLKNQVSPHFLLNTLNNIYALVAFNPVKAQEAIQSLSSLLRHMLYQDHIEMTTIENEVKFLQDYIELMKLRISDNVKVDFRVDLGSGKNMKVAPLLYISLVENAFKHGISCDGGHICIEIKADAEDNTISASITNSNHPKTMQDKSGHGVGLQLVKRRLDLLYPEKYDWKYGVNQLKNEYYSILIIHTA